MFKHILLPTDGSPLSVRAAKAAVRFASANGVAADCWLAAENLMLAAFSMGLGTCVIGSAISGLNTPEMKDELGIPAELSAIAPVIVGVPSGESAAVSRREPQILCWKQRRLSATSDCRAPIVSVRKAQISPPARC
jgi:nitroreductase